MFEKEVKTKDGFVKRVVAGSEEELREAIAAVKAESAPVSPNIDSKKDANVIVTPDNGTPGGIDYTPVNETRKKVAKKAPETKKESKVKTAVKNVVKRVTKK